MLNKLGSRIFFGKVYYPKYYASRLKSAEHAPRSAGNAVSKEQQHEDVVISHKGKIKTRPPLVKNFFTAFVDREMLAYPEVIPRENMREIKTDMQQLTHFMQNAKENPLAESFQCIQSLRTLGYAVPEAYNGKDFNLSSSLMGSAPESMHINLAVPLLAHRVVIDVINEFGSAQQKQYLQQLAKGEMIAVDAVFELNSTIDGMLSTRAQYEDNAKTWLLQGEKIFIKSDDSLLAPELILVLAQTDRLQVHNSGAFGLTAFLLKTSTPGVVLQTQESSLNGSGLNLCSVKFDNVSIHESDVLGEPHDAANIAEFLMRSRRLRGSLLVTEMAKSALSNLTMDCITTSEFGVQNESVELRLSHAECSIYAMESMIYYTAGLIDEIQKPDITLECAISKYFTITQFNEILRSCVEILGPKIFSKSNALNSVLENSKVIMANTEPLNALQLYIGLTGAQYAGENLGDVIVKQRNPLFHPMFIMKQVFQKSNIEMPESKLHLGENLHPSLAPAAQYLEHSIVRLKLSAQMLLSRYGNEVVYRHGDVKRLAESAAYIYATFASVSRASRSYCIGLPFADHELLAASTFAMFAQERVKRNAQEIFAGEIVTGDNNLKRLSKQLLKEKQFFFDHPLSYNF